MAQSIFYSKLSGTRFLDHKKALEYRKIDRLEIDKQQYRNMIDPITPMGGGGKAEFFASNFGAIPIDVHLDDIVKAKIEKIPDQIIVDVIDKFAKIQKQKDKEKIIWQREFRNLINQYTSLLGIPPMKESQSPYSYVKEFSKKDSKEGGKKDDETGIGAVDNMLDYIKTQIHDGQDLALYESYIYKGDVEIALELGIQHFLINLNKWKSEKWEWFINDLKNFNKACGRWYIDETNGRGTVEYIDPKDLYTSPFKAKNGEDIVYWYHESLITFAEFVRRFGQNLTDDQLKEVFELNKIQGGGHKMDYRKSNSAKGTNAFIQIGVFSVLTQDADTFSIKYINNNIPTLKREPLNWQKGKDADKKTIEQKIYNVWYSCYYVPPPGDRLQKNSQADWAWQSQYIFDLKKDIDMYRYGVDMRYAKSSLVIWKDETRPSWTDRKECYMPLMRTLWHKYQNCVINDKSGVVFSNELIGSVLAATDEANKINAGSPKPSGGNGTDAGLLAFRQLTQGGMAIGAFKDKQGNTLVNPQTLVVSIDNGMLAKAERYLKQMLELYQVMTTDLAQDSVSQGNGARPRTVTAGIEASLDASTNGIWFLEKPAREFMVMFGERTVQHIFNIVKEKKKYGFKERWEEFKNVIGLSNALMLEEIEDIQPESIGITVSLEDVSANKQYVFDLANKMASENQVAIESIGLVVETAKSNYKYAYVLLMLAAKNKAKEDANKQQLMHEQQMELEQAKLKTAQMLIGAKTQGKDQNIQTQGQVDAMIDEKLAKLKHDSMADLKNLTKDNKQEIDNNKNNLNIQAPN